MAYVIVIITAVCSLLRKQCNARRKVYCRTVTKPSGGRIFYTP